MPRPAPRTRFRLGAVATRIHRAGATNEARRGEPIERRQISVMFCDMVGSTTLAAGMDPEDLGQLMREYYLCCAEKIRATGGHLAQFQGDGVLAFFGYDQASESDAERAARAALALVRAVPTLTRSGADPLSARVGIATGLTIIGDIAADAIPYEQGATGEILNIAARLQALAEPNGIVIDETTKLLLRDRFELRPLDSQVLKGYSEPAKVWEVLRPAPLLARVGKPESIPVTMHGRDRELAALLNAWRKACEGRATVLQIEGEAGIGKSRLMNKLWQLIQSSTHIWLEADGMQFFGSTPFFPITRMLLRARLRRWNGSTAAELPGSVPTTCDVELEDLLTQVPSMPNQSSDREHTVPSPARRRDLFIAGVADWVLDCTRRMPTVLVLEDLHFMDPSSLELVGKLIARSEARRLLVIGTSRPGFRLPWRPPHRVRKLPLHRLDQDSLRGIVTEFAASGPALSGEIVQQIARRSGGVPLFAIELARLAIERRGQATAREIPGSLMDLLSARLDRLGAAKAVAQVAAVIADDISAEMLAAMMERPTSRIDKHLDRLLRGGVLEQTADLPGPRLVFSHGLIRDTAYEMLPRARRQELHRRAATIIAERFPHDAAIRPELLARHWTEAGDAESALPAWIRVGRIALSRRAFKEAEDAFRGAVASLRRQPDSAQRDAEELSVLGSLAEVSAITRGYSDQQTMEAVVRARELAAKAGSVRHQAEQAFALWAAASSRGDYSTAGNLADQFLTIARADSRIEMIGLAHMAQMTQRYRVGDLTGAEDHFERGKFAFGDLAFRERPGMVAQTFGNAARNAWIMGDIRAARERIAAALPESGTVSGYDLAYGEYMAAIMGLLMREIDAARQHANRAIALSDKLGFAQFAAISRIVLGRVEAEEGNPDTGVELMLEGFAGMVRTQSRVALTMYMTWLAEAEARGKSLNRAILTATNALEVNLSERFFRPETLRVRGDLLAMAGRQCDAERDFHDSVRLAQSMQATLFQERAVTSLSRWTAPVRMHALAGHQPAILSVPQRRGSPVKDVTGYANGTPPSSSVES